jgi:hypothetical protein
VVKVVLVCVCVWWRENLVILKISYYFKKLLKHAMHTLACELLVYHSSDVWRGFEWPNGVFHGGVQIILVAPPSLDGACSLLTFDLASTIFFFSIVFSLLLNFPAWPCKISKQSFHLLFLQIWSCCFDYYLCLFEMIYKIGIFFNCIF